MFTKTTVIFAFVRMISRIKKYLWRRALSKGLTGRDRKRESGNLITANNVFVIYDASEESQNKEAEVFFEQLKSLRVKVKSLGYAKYKIVPHYCIPQLTRQFICMKELNLLGIPSKSFLDDFLDEEFDLLISLDLEQNSVLQYLAAMSKAKFKVGFNHPDNLQYFDFLVGAREGDMQDYIKHLIHYLSIQKT